MDIETLCLNLINQVTQLNSICTNIQNIAFNIGNISSQEPINLNIIKSYVAAADIQVTAMNAQETIVQGLLDAIASYN